ncbi:MAG: DUF4175 family protein [Bacteroidota bacterium]
MGSESDRIILEMQQRLRDVRRKLSRIALARGIVTSALVCATGFLVLLVLESLFRFGVLGRTIAFWGCLSSVVAAFLWMTGRPALRLLGILPDADDQQTAAFVGRAFPEIKDRLLNVLQLHGEANTGAPYYSRDLIDESFRELQREAFQLEFTSVADYAESKTVARGLGVVAGVLLVLLLSLPGVFLESLKRVVHFDQAYAVPASFGLIVEPGNREIVKGERVEVVVRGTGALPETVLLATRPEGQTAYDEVSLARLEDNSYRHALVRVKNTTRYHVRSGAVRSGEFTLLVHDRPMIKLLRLGLEYPRYTRLGARQLEDNIGDVTALSGTNVRYRVEASKELSAAELVFGDGSIVALDVQNRHATGAARLTAEGTYHIRLRDLQGTENDDPIEYTQQILPDAYPIASIDLPGEDLDIAESTQLNMLFKITDDFGFSSFHLAHRLVHSKYEKSAEAFTILPIPLPAGITTEALVPYAWSLAQLTLVPEDVVEYFIEVSDNDKVSGPKSSVSETYLFRLPSLEEVFADLDRGHSESLDLLEETREGAEEARRELEQLQQDLRKEEEKMDWQDQQRADELVEQYEDIRKKVDEVSQMVRDMTDRLEGNELLSRETLEKYQELQNVLQEMDSQEFAEAMSRLKDAMRRLSPEALRQALEKMNFSEEAFRKSIERTISLLKRIQIEQKVDELIRRAAEMVKRQEELRKETGELGVEDAEKLSELTREQADLRENLEGLRRGLEELQKTMEEFPSEMPLDELAEARQELEEGKLEEELQEIVEQLQNMETADALEGQRNATEKMEGFTQKLQQMQDALRANQQKEIVDAMQRSLQDMLELSKRQEWLKNEARGLQQNSQQFRGLAQQQMELMRDLAALTGRIASLSQKTFGITPEMGQAIGDAMREMNGGLGSLERRNGTSAGEHQSSAMASLNEAAQLMQWSLNAMMEGGEGVGMAGLMQGLQRLTGRQQGINRGTQQLEGMTRQQAAALGRLAGEQGAVRKSLEQLAREAAGSGELSKLLGDLNRIVREMREVQTDLAQGDLNPETLRKQDRILSRLLESQRSLRERDYERRRRAEGGTNVARMSPGKIDLSGQESRNRLREDLLKALQEGYSRDYEELIRRYFEVLEQ